MKFLLLTLEYPPTNGGIAHYYSNLSANWPKANFDVLDNQNNELLDPKLKFFKWRPSIKNLYRLLKNKDIDYLLIGQILPLGASAWLCSFIFKFRYGVFFHGLDFSLATKGGRKKYLTKLILKRADKIISANSYVAKQLKEFLPGSENKTIIINPALTLRAIQKPNEQLIEKLKQRYDLDSKKIILSIGRLVRRKGFDYSLQALKQINTDNWVYVIIGDGPDRDYLKQSAGDLFGENYASKIIFTGEIQETEKAAWLDLADIFLMPSRNIDGDYEGFGIVYLEANAHYKPVIAGDSGGVRDAVKHGFNGLLINPENPQEISQAIEKLLNQPELAKNLGEFGYQRVITYFSWTKQAKKLYDFLISDK